MRSWGARLHVGQLAMLMAGCWILALALAFGGGLYAKLSGDSFDEAMRQRDLFAIYGADRDLSDEQLTQKRMGMGDTADQARGFVAQRDRLQYSSVERQSLADQFRRAGMAQESPLPPRWPLTLSKVVMAVALIAAAFLLLWPFAVLWTWFGARNEKPMRAP